MVSDQELNDKNILIDVDYYRNLVQSLISLRRYESALFWAEKICLWTKYQPSDVYVQAECVFLMGEFHRAAYLIKYHKCERTHFKCHLLLVECLFQAKNFNEAKDVLTSIDPECLYYSTYPKQRDASGRNDMLASLSYIKGQIFEALDKRSLAIDCYITALKYSIYCYEALDCLVKHEMLFSWEEQEILNNLPVLEHCPDGHAKIISKLYEIKMKKFTDPIDAETKVKESIVERHPAIKKIVDQVSNLREDKSKQIKMYKTLPIPELITSLSTPISLLTNIQKSINPDRKSASSFRMNTSMSDTIPTTSISLFDCLERLTESTDWLLAKAKVHFNKYEFKKCLKLLDETLDRDPFHIVCVTFQIGCLFEMKDYNKLFYVAHKLVDLYPDQAVSWYAVGSYYDLLQKCDWARRYFNKATSLDRLFTPAWIAYGHSFAEENEHDQAMAAYFKATQLMRGCHLPLLYIGVECGLTKNVDLAEMFFLRALSIAPMDVFILHELAVTKFESEDFETAEKLFTATFDLVNVVAEQNNEPLSAKWEPLLNNLGHCLRKNKRFAEAIEVHRKALVLKPQNSTTFTAIGFVQALMGDLEEAIESFHKSLALKHDEIFTLTILQFVTDDLKDDLDDYTDSFLKPNTADEEMVTDQQNLNADSGACIKMASAESGILAVSGEDENSVNMSVE